MKFVFTDYLCNVDLVLIFRAPKSSYNIIKRLLLQIKSGEEEGDQNKKTKLKHRVFTHKRKAFLKNQLKRQPSKTCFLIICGF